MQLHDYEQLQPHALFEGICFLTPNTHCAWRVDTLTSKEPDTYEWIRRMPNDAVLFDVGANMGQYSLLAAKRGITVHAFEPEGQNFALMCRNFGLNYRLPGKLNAWPLALGDMPYQVDRLYVTQLIAGGSCNTFGESVDYHLRPKEFKFVQGCMGTRIDDMTYLTGMPSHIKIDVDGFEHKVIAGAVKTLPNVKSVLIELNTALPDHQNLFAVMAEFGFKPDMATADKARRTEGPFKGVGNVIFFRDEAEFLSSGV
jgi:FkbM family methyltransferase